MIGQRIGHYFIEAKLGEGGMGVVYRARDEKLRRDVALKFLGILPSGSSISHEKVLEEARAISALNHPNICTVYEVGETEGRPYLAMEFVEGRPLSMEIISAGMSLDQVERYGMQLADALSHAHSRGIIHRDLKAANVIVTPSGRLKVLDFGISRRLETGGGEETTRFDKSWDSQHAFTGTLPYIAPEVLKGEKADERSDIWSLGVLLYEMAAGHRPFRGNTAYELSAAILRERAPGITPPLPQALQGVIDKCLDKVPGQRYQSAGEVRAALETASTVSRTNQFVNGGAAGTVHGRFGPWRSIVLVGAMAALALVAGYWLQSKKATKRAPPLPGAVQSVAVLPLENLSGDPSQEYFADGMTDALITELSQIKKLRVISRTSVMQYKHTQKPLPEIAQELNVDAIVEGSVLHNGNRIRVSASLFQTNIEGALWAEKFDRDYTEVLALQSDVATAIARGIQVELSGTEQYELARSRSVVPEAYEAYLRGKYEAAKRTPEGFVAAAEFFQKATQRDESFALAWAGLADAYVNLSNYQLQPAKQTVPKARQAAERALQLDDRLAEAHTSLAAIRFYHLEGGDIEGEFQRAISLNPGYSTALHWYALFMAANGRREESIREIKLAREIDPRSLIINANVGWCYYLARDYDRAIETEKVALQMDPSFAIAHGYLGQAYIEKQQYEEAVNELRTFVSLAPGDASREAELSYAYAISGKKEEAEQVLREFTTAAGKKYISNYDWAVLYAGLRDKDKTLNALEKAYEERNGRMPNLAVHPQFAFLRAEPRFQKLLSQMGLLSVLQNEKQGGVAEKKTAGSGK
jgi:eukaryotic-like serine/threonine-protein kinase